MTKIKVYIDFEAISAPFNRSFNINFEIPFAYTIGIFVGKKFKTKTYIVNFNTTSIENINAILRENIIRQIRELLDNKNFKVNKNTVAFYAFASYLEEKILENVFKGIDVEDVSKGKTISLAKVTEKEAPRKEYFYELRKVLSQTLEKSFIAKRGLQKDGAIAALAGTVLLAKSTDSKSKYNLDIDKRVLLKELREYSKDDVVRMKYVVENYDEFFRRYEKWMQIIKETKQNKKRMANLEKGISLLEEENAKTSLEELKKKLQQELSELKKINLKDEVL